MTAKKQAQQIRTYFERLTASDMDGIVALFTPDAVVNSPYLGIVPVAEFFASLDARQRRQDRFPGRGLLWLCPRWSLFGAFDFLRHASNAAGGRR